MEQKDSSFQMSVWESEFFPGKHQFYFNHYLTAKIY